MAPEAPKHWTESPCEHAWVLEPDGARFCRLCLIDGPPAQIEQAIRSVEWTSDDGARLVANSNTRIGRRHCA